MVSDCRSGNKGLNLLINHEQDTVLARLRDTCCQTNSKSEQKVHESLVTFLSERLRFAYDNGIQTANRVS